MELTFLPFTGFAHTVEVVILVNLLGVDNIARAVALVSFGNSLVLIIATPLCGECFALVHLSIPHDF